MAAVEAVFQNVCDRVFRSVAGLYIEGDNDSPFYVATGVFVRIGGTEFVLTAGHNVWNKAQNTLARISVSTWSREMTTHMRLGDGSVARVRVQGPMNGDPDPDVAVIELSDRAIVHPHRQPFEEEEIGFCASDAKPRQLVVGGFLSQLIPNDQWTGKGYDLGSLGRRKPVEPGFQVLTVWSMSGRRFAEEPASGRGIHVFLSRTGKDQIRRSESEVAAPHGMSGGPLVVPNGNGTLVGIARSCVTFEDGRDEWCEPVVEAIRLLLDHENPSVAAAAERVVNRVETTRNSRPNHH